MIIAAAFIISSCDNKKEVDEKRIHSILDSVKKTTLSYDAEKMIEHYKNLSPEQKAATQRIQIDYPLLSLIISNLTEKNTMNWELAAYDEEDAKLYVRENGAAYHARYPSLPELKVEDVINRPTVNFKNYRKFCLYKFGKDLSATAKLRSRFLILIII